MNSENNHNMRREEIGSIDAEIASVSQSLDRLGQIERDSTPADFEARMASTTMFALSAGRASSAKATHVDRPRLWLRLAAAVALISAGAIAWTMSRSSGDLGSGRGTDMASTTPASTTQNEGDDSEVYSLVALALDGGIGSDVDYLASDASEMHKKIGESPSFDDLLEGSTM